MFNSPFKETSNSRDFKREIADSDIIFIADMFADQYAGGAELTTEALIKTSGDLRVCKINASDVTMEILSLGFEKYWIFTNFSGLNTELIPTIIANLRYSVVEYDFKYCQYRSPEKHEVATGSPCDCHDQMQGKMVSAFFYGSESMFWMSERQKQKYLDHFPFLEKRSNVLLSSIFSKESLEKISMLLASESQKNDRYLIVGSESWIKGVEDSIQYCEENNLKYEVVSGLSHEKLLEKMNSFKGMVFLPLGGDTCPRTVIEAKLLGCELIINDNVLHKDEPWFASDSPESVIDWISNGPTRFWSEVNRQKNRQPTISGYTTTHNCISQKYPFEASISSLLGFCDQVVVVDGGSTDGTVQKLEEMAAQDSRLIIHVQKRDWDSKRFAVFDGLQKALGRALCTGEFCWQQDSDEIVHQKDYKKIKQLVKQLPKTMDLVSLPVIEFWGKKGKIRVDVNPWKWRLSRNRPYITHGIPATLRVFDEDGVLYSLPGSDGCDYIRSDSYEPIPFVNFYTEEAHSLRSAALSGDSSSLEGYSLWLQETVSSLPSVIHYSWYDIERKIGTYKNYWSKHWQSLYNIEQDDTAENNMFFNKAWSEVTDDEISEMASRLEEEMGGWIFHEKVNFDRPTPSLSVSNEVHPDVIKGWLN